MTSVMVAARNNPDATQPAAAEASGVGARAHFVPSRRLIGIVLVALMPTALAGMVDGRAGLVFGICVAVLALSAVIDAAGGLRRAGDVAVRPGGTTRLTLGREGVLELAVNLAGRVRSRMRFGLAAPEVLGVARDEPEIMAEGAPAVVRLRWSVRPRRRGVFRPGRLHVEIDSPLGLWQVRWAVDSDTEVRVYPNILGESRRLAAYLLHRPDAGWRVQRQVGRGREFEKLRDYLPGDGFDEIHWKATAKRGHPVTKVFQIERTQEVYAVVDASRLSGRPCGAAGGGAEGETDDTLLERQINAALSLALAAERQGDLFGLITVADTARSFLRARGGAAHFQACREELVRLQPETVSPDFSDIFTTIRTRLTKRALIVFLTSLDDPVLADAFIEALPVVTRRHIVNIAAPRPVDAAPLFSGDAPVDATAAYARLAGHMRWQGLEDLKSRLHRHGVKLTLLERDQLAAGAVSQYMALKQRQLI